MKIVVDLFLKLFIFNGKKISNVIAFVLIGLPFLSLIINAISWLHFGLDFPVYDDWRSYYSGQIHSLDLKYLFQPVNDTMTPVGFALDALAQRYLDGNSIAYQFLSMIVVLGGLLTLQFYLLRRTLKDLKLVSVCFVFSLLMIQPGSYWGLQNMAYHQALPLLAIFSILALVLNKDIKNILRILLIFFLALFASFSYISGAFSIFVMGFVFLYINYFSVKSVFQKAIFQSGWLLCFVGLFSVIIQYKRSILSSDAHGAGSPMAMPYEGKFWYYFLGKIGRSLSLAEIYPWLSVVIVLMACLIVFILMIEFLKNKTYWHKSGEHIYAVGFLFFTVTSVVFVYLAMVSAGRVNLKPSNTVEPSQIFLYGFQRFHFFWATLLWPWFAAALIVTWQVLVKPSEKIIQWSAAAVGIFLAVLMLAGGAFSHEQYYRAETQYRLPTLACVAEQLQLGDKIDCPELFTPDFRSAFAYGVRTGASFVRHFPILPVSLGSRQPLPWFRLTQDGALVNWQNVKLVGPPEVPLFAGVDPQMWFSTGRVSVMKRCLVVDVNVLMDVTEIDTAQLYYRISGDGGFSERRSVKVDVSPEGPQSFRFHLASKNGFEDSFRFDPVYKEQFFSVKELELRCRLMAPSVQND